MIGTVYKSTGSWYKVKLENGKFIDCRLLGKFREKNNPLERSITSLERDLMFARLLNVGRPEAPPQRSSQVGPAECAKRLN